MARKIIILERTGMPSDQNYRVAFWFAVPVARQPFYASATATSAVKDATAAEVDDIKAGAIIEEVAEVPATAGASQAALLANLVTRYNARQTEITNRNAYARYGSFWDGTTWTPVTVA